jgi:hypothetical protein
MGSPRNFGAQQLRIRVRPKGVDNARMTDFSAALLPPPNSNSTLVQLPPQK